MEEPTPQSVREVTGRIASLTAEETEQLLALLSGVKSAADRMREILPGFPGETDASSLSQTVDGDDV